MIHSKANTPIEYENSGKNMNIVQPEDQSENTNAKDEKAMKKFTII